MTRRTHRLTEMLGCEVIDAAGRPLGRLADFEVTLGAEYPAVSAVVTREDHHLRTAYTWCDGSLIAEDGITLGAHPVVTAPPLPTDADGGSVLSLVRDVLDVQVVDVDRRRVGRVADVDLATVDGDLRLVAVDIGLAGIMRRLGLGRFSHRVGHDSIDWLALHLASGPARAVQLDAPLAAIHRLDPEELAAVLALLPPQGGAEVLTASDDERAAAALGATHPELGADLIETLDIDQAVALANAMDVRAAGAVFARIAPSRRAMVMGQMTPGRAEVIDRAMASAPAPQPEPRRRWWRVYRGHGRPAP